jgi:hypothetical protein
MRLARLDNFTNKENHMTISIRSFAFGAAFSSAAFAGAEPARLAGHWEGAIHAPVEDVVVAVDVAAGEGGKLVGTFSSPSQRLNGFPLWSASVDGETVKIELKTAGPAVQTFDGRFSEDGQTIKGEFLIDVHAVPFTLKRNGDARIAPPPRSAPIDSKLVGSWTGSLNYGAQSLPLKLTLTNHADRTATGTWAAGGAPATPVAIAVEGQTLTLTSPITPASFTGTLSADGTQISGSLNEGGAPRTVVFTRIASGG